MYIDIKVDHSFFLFFSRKMDQNEEPKESDTPGNYLLDLENLIISFSGIPKYDNVKYREIKILQLKYQIEKKLYFKKIILQSL